MEFVLKEKTMTVKLERELDHHNAKEIKEVMDGFIFRGEVKNIVFDFEKTEFMDSSGIGVILGRYRLLKGVAGNIYVANINKTIDRILTVSGIYKIVEKCSEV